MRQSDLRHVDVDEPLVLRQRRDGSVVTADLPGGVGFGWSADELSGLSLAHLIHPDDRVVVERGRAWSSASGTDQVLNLRIRTSGGRWQWYEATVRSIDDEVAPIVMSLRDISETTLPQEALTMVIGLRNYIDVAADVDDVLVEAARRIVQFAQFDRAYVWADVDGTPTVTGSVGDIAAPPRPFEPTADASLAAMFDSTSPRVLSDRPSRDPRAANESPVAVVAAPVASRGDVLAVIEFESHRALSGKGVVVMIGDVLDQLADAVRRKGVEIELDIAQQQLGVAFSDAPIGMAFTTVEGRFTRVNRAAAELLGRDPDELLSMTVSEVSHPDERAVETRLLNEVLAGERDRFQAERRFQRPDGSTVQALSSVAVVRDSDGVPLQLINQMVDISAQKAREFQIAHRHEPPRPGSPVAIEALDAFLQAQAAAGLPTGVVRVRLSGAGGASSHGAIQAALDEVRRSTRNGDYFAPVTSEVALVAVAAFADDREELSNVVASVGRRIEAIIEGALGATASGGRVAVELDATVVDSPTARAAELFAVSEANASVLDASADE